MSLSRLTRFISLFSIVAVLLGLTIAGGGASSHREAPRISRDPSVDTTDVYAFRSPDRQDTVTLIANWWPFAYPAGGPNFYLFDDNARYLIKIDNNGDAVEDIVFEWRFETHRRNPNTFLYNTGPVTSLDDPDLNMFEFYFLSRFDRQADGSMNETMLASRMRRAPDNVGQASMPNYEGLFNAAIANLAGGVRAYAGPVDDPFFLDLRIFDLLYGGNLSEVGDDTLQGFNVLTTALQVPIHQLTRDRGTPGSASDPNAVIGVWATAERRTADGQFVQVSRLGQPLVNEVVIDLARKDAFNSIPPTMDAVALDRVTDPEVPKLLKGIYNIDSPPAPRNDLVTIFLTGIPGVNQPPGVRPSEMLRLNLAVPVTATPNKMGVLANDAQGFPNGRRLGDDVLDIALQVMAGATPLTPQFNRAPNNTLGDKVDANDLAFRSSFPYMALPHSGSMPNPATPPR